MTPINRKSEIETQTEDVKISNNKLPLFKRMFSVESTTSNVTGITNYYNLPTYINEYSICSCLITFKLIELVSKQFYPLNHICNILFVICF